MHIIILTTSYPRNPNDDTSVFIARHAEALVKAGALVHVVVPLDREEPEEEVRNGVHIYRVRYGLLRRGELAFGASLIANVRSKPWTVLQAPLLVLQLARKAFQLIKMSRRAGSEPIVHAEWILAAAAGLLLRLTRVKFVASMLGSDMYLVANPITAFVMKIILSASSRIIVVSNEFIDLLSGKLGIPKSKIIRIDNGAYVPPVGQEVAEVLFAKHNIKTTGKYLLALSSLTPRKRIEKTIEWLADPALNEYTLLLAGKTDDESYVTLLRQRAEEVGCLGRVKFLGAVPPHEVGAYLANSTYFVSASSYEGRPNALVEALSFGKLSFVSDIPAHREVISHGVNGFLIKEGEGIAPYAAAVLRDVNLRNRIQAEAATTAVPYTWKTCAEKHIEVYTNALNPDSLKP